MRFTVSSSALSGKLTALSRVINSKNALPILGDFVFEIKDGILYLTASDSENTMKTQLDLTESDGDCRFAIGNHDLLEAVKGFSVPRGGQGCGGGGQSQRRSEDLICDPAAFRPLLR